MMNLNDTLRSLNVGLPEDIARLKAAGYYEEAIAQIDARLAEDWVKTQNCPEYQGLPAAEVLPENPMPSVPDAQAACMMAEREIMRRIPRDFCLDEEAALALLRARIPDFSAEEFRALVADNRIDWRFVNGQKAYCRRFVASLLDTDASYAARAGQTDSGEMSALRNRMAAEMREKGQKASRIALHTEIRASQAAFDAALEKAKAEGRTSVHVKAWLPLPAACPAQSEISLDGFSQTPCSIAPETAQQRTAFWETDLTENRTFTADYSYTDTAVYTDPLTVESDDEQPVFFLHEEAPHIMFTPFLRALAAQLTAGVTDPVQKAKRIYDYITLNVHYRYMPAYFTLNDIADNCARSRRGDCGVMALTFITLCRLVGIPAKWQSGLSVTPKGVGCHDWAMFYIAPKGWMHADCSFGGSAARAGEEERRKHYFGNLDPCRMVANKAFEAPLDPPKTSWRADPYDNQTGEIELDGVGLYGDDAETAQTLKSYEEL